MGGVLLLGSGPQRSVWVLRLHANGGGIVISTRSCGMSGRLSRSMTQKGKPVPRLCERFAAGCAEGLVDKPGWARQ